MKKTLAFILTIFMLLGVFTSCVKETDEPDETGIQTEESISGFVLSKDTVRIVYSADEGEDIKNSAKNIRDRIKEYSGETVSLVSDMEDESGFEILVGEVARNARLSLSSELVLIGSEYCIVKQEDCLIILGGTSSSTVTAVNQFLSTYLTKEGSHAVMPENINYVFRMEGSASVLLQDKGEKGLYFTLKPTEDYSIYCLLEYTGNTGWRIRTSLTENDFSTLGASQYLSDLLKEEKEFPTYALSYQKSGDVLAVSCTDGSYVKLNTSPFQMDFYAKDGTCIRTVTSIQATDDGCRIEGTLTDTEGIFGTGERFDTSNQRGNKLTLYSLDQWNVIGGNGYLTIPLFLSSRGGGIFMNRYERMTADLGNADKGKWVLSVEKAPLDCYIFASTAMSDALNGYSALSGYADVPEDWSYGMLICRYAPDFSNTNIQSIYDMVDEMEENNLSWSGIILEAWDIYNKSTYEDLKKVVDDLHALGKKVLVYCRMGVVYSNKVSLPNNSYLLKIEETDSISIPDVTSSTQNPDVNSTSGTHYYLDVTNEDACDWFFDEIWGPLVNEIGIDGAKIDFCEQLPDNFELTFANGTTSGAHHWYPTYFNTLFYNMVSSKPDGGMIFARGGGIGSQRNPFLWAGDQVRDYSRLEAQLQALLSVGMSGVPFITYDMAGYKYSTNKAEKALQLLNEEKIFIRATEFTAFTACMETHGNVKNVYEMSEETINIYRSYLEIHDLLTPYLHELSVEASQTGMPLVRHLILQYQSDTNVYGIDDEFLLGSGLLLAPELNGNLTRDIYLPEGTWKDLRTGTVYTVGSEGMTLKDYSVPLNAIPMFLETTKASTTLLSCLDNMSEILDELR